MKWSAIERFSLQGIQFLLGLILARLLTPEDYGIVGMIAIFIAIAQTFVDSGFSNALIRKNNRSQEDCSTVFYFNIVVAVLLYGVLFFSSPLIADLLKTPILVEVVRVVALNLIVNSFAAVQIAQFTISLDFKTQAKITLSATIVSGIAGIAMAYYGFGVWALVFQTLTSNTLKTIMFWISSKWHPSFVFSVASFKELGSYGSKLLASSLISTIYANITTLLIGRFYTPKALGFYTRGDQFANLPSTNLVGILQRVTFPILAKIQDDEDRMLALYRKYIRLSSFVVFGLMLTLATCAKPLIVVLLTEKWADAALYLQIICFAVMFDHITTINMNLLQVKGRSDLVLKTEVIKKIFGFAIVVGSIPLGVIAICFARVLYSQIAVAIGCYFTGKVFKLSYKDQLMDYMPYFLKGCLISVPAYVLSIFDFNVYLSLILCFIFTAGLYSLIMLRDDSMKEIVSIVRPYLKRK